MLTFKNLPPNKEPGDRLRATEVNQIVEGVRKLFQNNPTFPGGSPSDPGITAQWVWANNTGEETIGIYRPVGITGQAFAGASQGQIDKRLSGVLLDVVNPLESTKNFEGHFAIAAERILSGNNGRVWISGICPAWAVSNEGEDIDDFTYTELLHQIDEEGEPAAGFDYLECSSGGSSRIIWKKNSSSPNEQLIMIRLGFASVMISPPEIIPVKITSKVNYNTYIGNEYEDGIDESATDVGITIRILEIANTETIPNGRYFPAWLQKWGGILYRTINVARDY